jgi:hypothetical protein
MTGNVTSTASDIILGALLNINAYSPGQPLNAQIASVCMQIANDLLDSLSIDQAFIYTQNENIVQWTPGQYQYTIGNPTSAIPFTGYTTQNSNVITGASIPTNLIVGATLTDQLASIPSGTTVTAINTSTSPTAITFTSAPTGTSGVITVPWAGVSGLYLVSFSDGEFRSATLTNGFSSVSWTPALIGTPSTAASVNTNTVTMSNPANQTLTTGDLITYTTPGDFAFQRPARIRRSFTRVTTSAAAGLDYWFELVAFERYNEIGLKTVPGPWPYLAAYQPTFPLGTLWVYPNPSIAGQVFLYTDLILSQFTSPTQQVNLPQGYNRALKKLLALELCPTFGKTPSPQLILQAKEAKNLLKDQNSSPVTTLRYDADLVYANHNDASFVIDGGFR